MTATEELRRLLDERGVEWEGETDEDGWAFTRWHGFDDTGWLAASDELCGLLDLRGRYLFTPEQAIAATLGATDATATRQVDAVPMDELRDFFYRCVPSDIERWRDEDFHRVAHFFGAKVVDA